MRIITTILALVLIASPLHAGKPDKQLHEKCLYPTIMIGCAHQQVNRSGTGVVIKSIKLETKKDEKEKWLNLAVTCAHILKMSPPVFEEQKKGEKTPPKMIVPPRFDYVAIVGVYKNWSSLEKIEQFKCDIQAFDRSKDVAIVTFETNRKLHTVNLDFNPKLYIGNKLYKVGSGMGELFRVDFGRVTSLNTSKGRSPGLENTYRTSIPTVPGDSGGPVFHNYKLIGVSQAIKSIRTGPVSSAPIYHLSFVIPLDRFAGSDNIRNYLSKHEEFKDLLYEPQNKD